MILADLFYLFFLAVTILLTGLLIGPPLAWVFRVPLARPFEWCLEKLEDWFIYWYDKDRRGM